LPESAATTAPAAPSGWAARQEDFESSDSVVSATTAWEMPATHSDAPQPDDIHTPESEEPTTPSASDDDELPAPTESMEASDATPPIAAWQSLSAAESEPEIEPSGEIPIISDVEDETTAVEGNREPEAPSAEIEPAASEEAVAEPVSPIAEVEDVMTGENPEPDAPASDFEAIVIEESTESIAPDDPAETETIDDVVTEGAIAAPESTSEQPEDANPSPLEEAAFEEMLPYATEAGSEWEPTTEPDEIFALDEIEFEEPVDFEASAQIVSSDASASEESVEVDETGNEAMLRANQLIEELRGLLPALTTPSQTVLSPEYATLREQAIAARGDVSFDQFAALREVVQEALSRPRDVEVVLRLSRRVEDMNALLGERDRLQQAFEQLIAQLDANESS
jgi:hypothetical protein